MKVAVFSTKKYDREFLEAANSSHKHKLQFFEGHLSPQTCSLAAPFPGICVFVHDQLNAEVLKTLADQGTRLIALRCAGFNNVDLAAAEKYGLTIVRVPAYSPYAVAEHTVGLMLSLNRKIHRSFVRVREGNFALEGLMGFDIHGLTIGIIGTGKIGAVVANILKGFQCRILAFDPNKNPECEAWGVLYVPLDELYEKSDIVTLHCPLTPKTHHMINAEAIGKMKTGVMVINTSRGALIDTRAAVRALKSGKIGYLGLDVYEEEGDLFFENLSDKVIFSPDSLPFPM
jgi:D-lactate dehydrogenase